MCLKLSVSLVQKLSQFSCSQKANDDDDDDATPWLWAVLDQQTAGSHRQQSDESVAVSVEARAAAFFRLMTSLPPAAVVTCQQRSPVVRVRGLAQLRGALNDLARNTMTESCTLAADLTLHLVLTLASLPVDANDDLQRFLSDCPLITLSAMHHFASTHGAVVDLAACGNAIADLFVTISSAAGEARTLLDGGSQPPARPSSLPAWLRAAALWSQLHNSNYGVDASRLTTDVDAAEALLLWLTVDLAAGMLRGTGGGLETLEDVAVAVWCSHVDALRCLSDCDDEPSSTFRRCVPDLVLSVHPLACLRLFVRAASSGRRFLSGWDVTRTLRWYIRCVQMFDSGARCAVVTVLTLLQQASQAICSFIPEMSQSQLRAVDQATLDELDPHIRIVLQQFRNS